MKNTYTYWNGKYSIPQEYIHWKAGVWIEMQNDDEIQRLQAKLLYTLLISGEVSPFGANELERLQHEKEKKYGLFHYYWKSIPLVEIWSPIEIEKIISWLSQLGAKSTVFERYAWLSRRNARNPSQWSTLLQTQACRI